MPIVITPYADSHRSGVRDLIVPIQRHEFGIEISYDDQPDLRDIDGFYRSGAGEFWVALDGERVVGSIALVDIGDDMAALRKMFVAEAYRGHFHGVAARLLETLITHARARNVDAIYLGTTAAFLAAHRFYEKAGFDLVDEAELPASFPRMAVDTRFYRLSLADHPASALTALPRGPGRMAIIDIGSNTVRLVVYDDPMGLPVPLFNEKVQCQLGRGLAATGRLNQDGIPSALDSIAWFCRIAEAMGAEALELVATAAVRDAADGMQFTRQIESRTGHAVTVLSGDEEARAAALSLLRGVPRADGLVCDLGGGSLDVMELSDGAFGRSGTLALGHLRLSEDADGSRDSARAIVAERLAALPWIKDMAGRPLFAVGGSLRALARAFIEMTGHPLHIIDSFELGNADARKLAKRIIDSDAETLRAFEGMNASRAETLPMAAIILHALLKFGRPNRLVFSGYGLREGRLIHALPPAVREQDALTSACRSLAGRSARFDIGGDELLTWTDPLFGDETPQQTRLRRAACLLADIGWTEHPDYRAEHAFYRVLRFPFAGVGHADRAFLALAIFVRYHGKTGSPIVAPVRALMNDDSVDRAHRLGLACRLAHTLSGGAPALLETVRPSIADGTLTLVFSDPGKSFLSETARRRVFALADSLGLVPAY